jgi:hypothetical protein
MKPEDAEYGIQLQILWKGEAFEVCNLTLFVSPDVKDTILWELTERVLENGCMNLYSGDMPAPTDSEEATVDNLIATVKYMYTASILKDFKASRGVLQ